MSTSSPSKPSRPLVGLCAAVALGSAAGTVAAGVVEIGAWRALLGVGLAAWFVSMVAFRARPALLRSALLCACAATAGLRAASEASTAQAPEAHPPLLCGAFEESAASVDQRGRVEGCASTLILPRAIVGAGEIVALDPVNDAPQLPRGPELGPRARSGSRPAIEIMPDELARLATAPRTWLTPLTDAVRDLRARLAFRTHTVRDPETRAFLLALLFGDTSELPIEMPDLFVRTGTFHVLAVSGMQVVLVVLLLIGPASKLLALLLVSLSFGRVRASSTWFALPLVVLLVPVAGAGAPIVRSVMGSALSLVAPTISRRRTAVVESGGHSVRARLPRRADSLSFWSLALIVECVLHPDAPLSLSVQLSYAATLGLIVGTGPFLALLRAWCGPREPVTGVTRTGHERGSVSMIARLSSARLASGALCAVAASIAAVMATLPFVWSRLSEWSPWGILATPVLAPSMTALLGLGWLRVLFGALVVPDAVLVPCARAMTGSMRAFDVLPFTPTPLPPRPVWLVAFACVATFHSVSVWRRRSSSEPGSIPSARASGAWQSVTFALQRSGASARAAALAWAVLLVPWSATPARLEIHALDVGAGTAVVLEGPGLGTWVFDAGSRDRPDVAREALGPLLRRLDPGPVGIVLSHSDRDHESALPWLVERFPPRAYAGALPAHLAERLPHACDRIDLATGRARLPAFSGGAAGVELWLERGLDVDGNEGSRVLRVRAGDDEAILCGDAEEYGLRAWIRAFGGTRARLVLWPHHGSDTDLLDPFLRATRPAEVWISASGDPPVHAELVRRAIVTQCTAFEGPLHIQLGSGMFPAPSPAAPGR